jgi:ribokinase
MRGTLKKHPPPHAGRIVVVGTLNIDVLWRVSELPRAGETVLAKSERRAFGGKGANQAVAAARQGVDVALVGAVGDDTDGRVYRQHLTTEGIRHREVATISGIPTGSAQIFVDDEAENMIVVDPGANGRLTSHLVAKAFKTISGRVAVVSVQLECPLGAAVEALRRGRRIGARTLLNPSPVNPEFPWGRQLIDGVVVNEHECRAIFDRPPAQLPRLERASRQALLRAHGVRHLIVTRGSAPTLLISDTEVLVVPTLAVTPRDTVGAGDTFAGTLAARLAADESWGDAVRHANIAAALSTLRLGAQATMPTRAAVERAARKFPR